jgi:hypothetical protein
MNKQFQTLFETVDTLKISLEERNRLIEEQNQLASTAREFMNSVFNKYKAAEKEIEELTEQAEHENEENKAAITEMTLQQLKARNGGEVFLENTKLDHLKADVSTYPLKLEAMEKLKNEIHISASDQKQISNYRAEGLKLGGMIFREGEKLQNILVSLRDGDILNCFASLDPYFETLHSREFLDGFYEEYKNMRKEEYEV